MLVYLVAPVLDRLECAGTGQVESHDDTVAILVVQSEKRSILFLPSRIPYIDGNFLVSFQLALESLEAGAESRGHLLGEAALGEGLDDGGFSNA